MFNVSRLSRNILENSTKDERILKCGNLPRPSCSGELNVKIENPRTFCKIHHQTKELSSVIYVRCGNRRNVENNAQVLTIDVLRRSSQGYVIIHNRMVYSLLNILTLPLALQPPIKFFKV